MNMSIRELDGATVVRFDGNLDSTTSAQAEERIQHLIDSSGPRKILMDFGALGFISSAGLRVVLTTAKKLRAGGGDLRICSLNDTVREIFDISGFATILSVFDREEDALRGF